jgi:hypothetical protein
MMYAKNLVKIIAYNGSGLAEGLDFEKRQPIKALKLIEKLLFKICTSASLLANPC